MQPHEHELKLQDAVFGLDLSETHLAVGLVTGAVRLYALHHGRQPTKTAGAKAHAAACRAVRFSADGTSLYSTGSDRQLLRRDVAAANRLAWRRRDAHDAPINALALLGDVGVATGDDDGAVRCWDPRQAKPALAFCEHSDLIADLLFVEETKQLAACSADGMLSVYDLRRGRLDARSDDLEDELGCLALLKRGKKLVCGQQSGVLGIFSWGDFGDVSDRALGHAEAVDAMVRYTDNIVLTGSADGKLRAVGIHPNRVLGVVGSHAEGVEAMALGGGGKLLGSAAADGKVRLWDVSSLEDEAAAAAAAADGGDDSDDEGDGGDDEDDETDGDESEGEGEKSEPAKKRLRPEESRGPIKLGADFFEGLV